MFTKKEAREFRKQNDYFRKQIYLYLKEHGRTSVFELAKYFDLTVQRVLALCYPLLNEGKIKRIRGYLGVTFFEICA